MVSHKMKTKVLSFECLTPTFLSGYDSDLSGYDLDKVEFHLPSIKGALRYWWRALYPIPKEELHDTEGRIFGTTKENGNQRSPFSIRLYEKNSNKGSFEPTKSGDFRFSGFSPGSKFKIKVRIFPSSIGFEKILDIFQLTFFLGNLGQRSRRGFGAIYLKGVHDSLNIRNLREFLSKNKHISDSPLQFENTGDLEFSTGIDGHNVYHPVVKTIRLGEKEYKDWEPLIDKIKKAASTHSSSQFLGTIDGNRIASPVYVSVHKTNSDTLVPIITELTLPESTRKKINNHSSDERNDFIKDILNE